MPTHEPLETLRASVVYRASDAVLARWLQRFIYSVLVVVGVSVTGPGECWAQNSELSGFVRDEQGGVIPHAHLRLVEQARGVVSTTRSNERGLYVFASVKPGIYRIEVTAAGFASAQRTDITLNVDQRAAVDIVLSLGERAETVTVAGSRTNLGNVDGSVGVVIDQRLAKELPLLGRSFSSLVALAPGVSGVPNAGPAGGEFSVNGQRAISNYLTVDGVSALSETGSPRATIAPSTAGERFASTITGGLGGLVSMDALQEIRIQTSSFAAEFGRTPGAQISLVTRSGTNTLNGSLFEQFRNDTLMANDWFANSRAIEKPPMNEHQFGFTIGGPILRNRSFFFGSYEGLRLKQPRIYIQQVPSIEAREVNSEIREILNLFPRPTGTTQTGLLAEYAGNHPQRTSSDTWGIRLDHAVGNRLRLFSRYSYAPSLGKNEHPLAGDRIRDKLAESITVGATSTLKSNVMIDVRAVYGKSAFSTAPIDTPPLRKLIPLADADDLLLFSVFGVDGNVWNGQQASNNDRQGSVVGSLSYVTGAHHLKAGFDYRHMAPRFEGTNGIYLYFDNIDTALSGRVVSSVEIDRMPQLHATHQNGSLFLQDTWRMRPRLSITYGTRWDVNPAPSYSQGEGPFEVLVIEPVNQLKLSPRRNVPQWSTDYGNVFPRVGLSYARGDNSELTISGGIGLFGDLLGPAAIGLFPRSSVVRTDVPLPLSIGEIGGIDIDDPAQVDFKQLVDPNLKTPRTTQWNLTVERALTREQVVSVSYVGARGGKLLQTSSYRSPTPDIAGDVYITRSTGESRYHSMQLQYQRRSVSGVHALVSYTLGSSRDTSSYINGTSRDREGSEAMSPSDADVRHAANVAVSWRAPGVGGGMLAMVTRDWSLHAFATARSGYPFTVEAADQQVLGATQFVRRASLVPSVPIIVSDSGAPGGQRFNRAAFVDPPDGKQGDTGRNAFRWFAAYQLDCGLTRTVRVTHGIGFEIRVDAFNVFNSPAFALPLSNLFYEQGVFGTPVETINMSGGGEVGSLYRRGAPRSLSLSARLVF